MLNIQSRLKLMPKFQYDLVKEKYTILDVSVKTEIDNASEFDILAFEVVEGSGLKILSVTILNEDKIENFNKLLKIKES